MERKEAHISGLKYYDTGRKCKRGHLSQRLVASGACVKCLAMYRSYVYAKGYKITVVLRHVDDIKLIEKLARELNLERDLQSINNDYEDMVNQGVDL